MSPLDESTSPGCLFALQVRLSSPRRLSAWVRFAFLFYRPHGTAHCSQRGRHRLDGLSFLSKAVESVEKRTSSRLCWEDKERCNRCKMFFIINGGETGQCEKRIRKSDSIFYQAVTDHSLSTQGTGIRCGKVLTALRFLRTFLERGGTGFLPLRAIPIQPERSPFLPPEPVSPGSLRLAPQGWPPWVTQTGFAGAIPPERRREFGRLEYCSS